MATTRRKFTKGSTVQYTRNSDGLILAGIIERVQDQRVRDLTMRPVPWIGPVCCPFIYLLRFTGHMRAVAGVDAGGYRSLCECRLTLVHEAKDDLDRALATFKIVLAQERGRGGRDSIRNRPQGLLLDALDAGRPDTSHDPAASAGKITALEAELREARRDDAAGGRR